MNHQLDAHVMLVTSEEGDDVEVEDGALGHQDGDGRHAEKAVVDHLFVAHSLEGVAPIHSQAHSSRHRITRPTLSAPQVALFILNWTA